MHEYDGAVPRRWRGITSLTGLLIILLGAVHIIYGETIQIPDIKTRLGDPAVTASMRVMIYQGGIVLLATGIVQLLVGTGHLKLHGTARFFPVALLIINILTFVSVAAATSRGLLRTAAPQAVVFLVIIILMMVDLRRSGGDKRARTS